MASTSWTGIPRDDREQERLRLEHQLFRNISFDDASNASIDFDSVEFPRNPQQLSHDFTAPDLSIRYPGMQEDGETRSTTAHHAHGVTFRTGLRGRGTRRRVSGAESIEEYDPDRPLDVLLQKAADLSILADSPSQAADRSASASQSRSEFTKRADGLSRRIDIEKSRRYPLLGSLAAAASANASNPYQDDTSTQPIKPSLRTTKPTTATPSKIQPVSAKNPYSTATYPSTNNRTPTRVWPAFTRVQLPDVTGITTAVETPAKGDVSYKRVPPTSQLKPARFPPTSIGQPHRPVEPIQNDGETGVTAAALDGITKRLKEVEKENATSRRRVTELEMELEGCKEEVKKEKTKLLDLSRDFAAHQVSANGRNRRNAPDASLQDAERRYKEVVEEKKALEGLVQSLNMHMAQMSQKVQNHQDAILQLRETREQDAKELREKCQEIESLRTDVETLHEDVERLREVVEAGLQERKSARGDVENSIIVVDPTEVINIPPDEDEEEPDCDRHSAVEPEEEDSYSNPLLTRRLRREPDVLSAVMEEEEPSSTRDLGKRSASSRGGSRRFIKDSELERVRQEIAERRSQRSMTASLSHDNSGSGSEKSHSRSRSYAQGFQAFTRPTSPVVTNYAPAEERVQYMPPRPDSRAEPGQMTPPHQDQEPIPSRDCRVPRTVSRDRHHDQQAHERTPSPTNLPQIRGERLERLFRATPEHDEQKCGVCHRKKKRSRQPSSSKPARLPKGEDPEKEAAWNFGDEKYISGVAARRGLPPQTVLARVLRELEDDFTHYKAIYVELADQYKAMDAASDASKRRLLADHLREIIDVLEQKADQIASLYDLLHFEDKPLPPSSAGVPSSRARAR